MKHWLLFLFCFAVSYAQNNDTVLVFSETFDGYPNWTFGTLADTASFQLGSWTYGKNKSFSYPSSKPYHYVNISNGVIYGIGSGYGHDSDPNWPDASIDIPINLDGTNGFTVEFRAQCLSSWPNALAVHLFSNYNSQADTNNASKVYGYGFNIYGESANYTFDLIKYPQPQYSWYREFAGSGIMLNWHTYKFTRNSIGKWAMYIDEVLRATWIPPSELDYKIFNRLLITSMKDGGKLDWIKLYSIKPSAFKFIVYPNTHTILNDVKSVTTLPIKIVKGTYKVWGKLNSPHAGGNIDGVFFWSWGSSARYNVIKQDTVQYTFLGWQDTTYGRLFFMDDGDLSDNSGSIEVTFQRIVTIVPQMNQHVIPIEFKLSQNYPNPFNPSTKIDYKLNKENKVEIDVYDNVGRLIKILLTDFQSSGEYSITWDGRNEEGKLVSSGTYFYQFRVGNYSETKKMILLK